MKDERRGESVRDRADGKERRGKERYDNETMVCLNSNNKNKAGTYK